MYKHFRFIYDNKYLWHYYYICVVYMCVEPKMRHLNNMVIPKIAAYWKKVADALEFEVWKIKNIEKKYRNDPEECCDELLREWLSSGLGLHPKTWSTLINALKEVKQLTAVTETIETHIFTNTS